MYSLPKIIVGKDLKLKPISDFYFLNVGPSEELNIKNEQVVFIYNDTKDDYDIAGWVEEKLKFAAIGLKMNFAQDEGSFNYYKLLDSRDFKSDNNID